MRKSSFALLWVSLFVFSGCGTGTDPLYVLGDASQSDGPAMVLPLATLQGFNAAYSSSNDGFSLLSQGFGTVVRAPGEGLVITADAGSGSVTLLHNVHIQSRVRGIIPSVTVGSYVAQGATIGTVSSTNSSLVHFSVVSDGATVCPLSYLSSAGRTQLATVVTTNPCIQ